MSRSKPSNKSLFLAAIDIESDAERAAFLQEACGDNNQLQEEIESLLDAHGNPPEVLKRIDNAKPTDTQLPCNGVLTQTVTGGIGARLLTRSHSLHRRNLLQLGQP